MPSLDLSTLLQKDPSLGELRIDIPPSECGRFGLSAILLNDDGPVAGQRVRVSREHWCRTPPCADCTFEIVRSERRNGDFFLSLRDVATGTPHRTLHRWDEVEPAPSTKESPMPANDTVVENLMTRVGPRAAVRGINLSTHLGQSLKLLRSEDVVDYYQQFDSPAVQLVSEAVTEPSTTDAKRFERRVLQLKASGLDDLAALTMAQQEDRIGAEAYRRGL
jgi:hypothetical protein